MRKDRISFLSWKEDKIVFWWEITRAGQRGQSACWLSISSSCSVFSRVPNSMWCVCPLYSLWGCHRQGEVFLRSAFICVFPAQTWPFLPFKSAACTDCWVMGGQDADLGNAGPELRTAPFETMTPIPSPLRKAGCSHWSKMVLLNLQYWPFSSSP